MTKTKAFFKCQLQGRKISERAARKKAGELLLKTTLKITRKPGSLETNYKEMRCGSGL